MRARHCAEVYYPFALLSLDTLVQLHHGALVENEDTVQSRL